MKQALLMLLLGTVGAVRIKSVRNGVTHKLRVNSTASATSEEIGCSFFTALSCNVYEAQIGQIGDEFKASEAELKGITDAISELSEEFFDTRCHDTNAVKAEYEALVVRYQTVAGHMAGHKTDIDEIEARMRQDGCFPCFEEDIHTNNDIYTRFVNWKTDHPCEFIDQAAGLGATAIDFGLKLLIPELAAVATANAPFCSAVGLVKDKTRGIATGHAIALPELPYLVEKLVSWKIDNAVAKTFHNAYASIVDKVVDLVCPHFLDSFDDGDIACSALSPFIQQITFVVLDFFCGDVASAMWKVVRPLIMCNVDNGAPGATNSCGEELNLGCSIWPSFRNGADDPTGPEELEETEFYPQQNTAVKGDTVKILGQSVKLFRSDYCNDAKYLSDCQAKCESVSSCVGFVDDHSRSDRRCVLKKTTNGYSKANKTFYTSEKRGCGGFQHRKYCLAGNSKTYNIGTQNLPSDAVVDYELCGNKQGEEFKSCCYRFCEDQTETGCCFANDYQTENIVLSGNASRAIQEPRRQCAFLPDSELSSADIPAANVGRHAKWGSVCNFSN